MEHWSSCAVHNEPYKPNGPCDCGGYNDDRAELDYLRRANHELIEQVEQLEKRLSLLEKQVAPDLSKSRCTLDVADAYVKGATAHCTGLSGTAYGMVYLGHIGCKPTSPLDCDLKVY